MLVVVASYRQNVHALCRACAAADSLTALFVPAVQVPAVFVTAVLLTAGPHRQFILGRSVSR
jgi:hypothetical protein